MIGRTCRWLIPVLLILSTALWACKKEETQTTSQAPATEEKPKAEQAQPSEAVAEMKPTQGNNVTGKVTFTAQEGGGVRIVADFEGLSPGRHGFHVHEKGDCSAPDATSAGEHFNPANTPHGAMENPASQRHAGDMGNVEAGEDGKAHFEKVDQVISLAGENSILGKAVIVHAQPDDLSSQPVGNAGPRQACGVIEPK